MIVTSKLTVAAFLATAVFAGCKSSSKSGVASAPSTPSTASSSSLALAEKPVSSPKCDKHLADLAGATGYSVAQLGAAFGAALGNRPMGTPAMVSYAAFADEGQANVITVSSGANSASIQIKPANPKGIQVNRSADNECHEGKDSAGTAICPSVVSGGVDGIQGLDDANQSEFDGEGDDPAGINTLMACFDNTPETNPSAFADIPKN